MTASELCSAQVDPKVSVLVWIFERIPEKNTQNRQHRNIKERKKVGMFQPA